MSIYKVLNYNCDSFQELYNKLEPDQYYDLITNENIAIKLKINDRMSKCLWCDDAIDTAIGIYFKFNDEYTPEVENITLKVESNRINNYSWTVILTLDHITNTLFNDNYEFEIDGEYRGYPIFIPNCLFDHGGTLTIMY